jgi:hypothetical protein
MAWTLIRDIARMLSPDRPILFLARLAGRPRASAKAWASGHRRPSIAVLKSVLGAIRRRQAECAGIAPLEVRQILSGLAYELEDVIRKRSYEVRRRTGFNEIKERDGPGSVPRDGRNRLRRPKRITAADRGINYVGRGR